ncbi:MAG: hypothetical protein DRQ10_05390 [Candidatus Hydrothermota bacterium]|nr:MAG: hypothetical protein DRQ10_05390 [Candidatus Hydrothermae bacterium]
MMKMRTLKKWTIYGVGLAASVAMIAMSSSRISSQKLKVKSYWVPKAKYIKAFSLEFDNAISDFFWMRLTLTYGERNFEKKATEKDWKYLVALTDLVTDLDPKFQIPYIFAGAVLTWQGDMPKDAERILLKGLKARPDDWLIPFYLGFVNFYFIGDTLKGAEYLSMAARKPGAPSYVPLLAARLRSRAGDIRTAINFLEGLLATIKDERTRKPILKRLKALRDIYMLESAVRVFKSKFNRLPRSIIELKMYGLIDSIPTEPYGGYYYIDQKTGRVWSSTDLGKKKHKSKSI